MALFLAFMLNERQEVFALGVARGLSGAAAYREAYNAKENVAKVNAARLLTNANVKARIAEVRADMAAASQITVPFLTGLLLNVYRKSISWGQGSAASQAAMGIGKLHGLLVDKQQLEVAVRRPSASPDSPDDMPETDWLDKYSTVIDASPILESPSIGNTRAPSPDTVDIQQNPSRAPVENPDSITQDDLQVSAVDLFGHDL